jgi:trimeric autotransporter adhesin
MKLRGSYYHVRIFALSLILTLSFIFISFQKSSAQLPDELHITMVQDAMTSDEIVILFYDGASTSFDDFDGLKLPNSTINLSSLSTDNYELAINIYPLLTTSVSIPLSVSSSSSGNFSLNFSGLNTFTLLSSLTLYDAYTNQTININNNPVYNFSIDNTIPATYGSSRFTVTFNMVSITNVININYFTGAVICNDVALLWLTTQQQNVNHFEIERSTNGINFTKLNQVNGAGTSISTLFYLSADLNPLKGKNYYRVKTIFNNNASSYSNAIYINNKSNKKEGEFIAETSQETAVYPNPCRNELNIHLTEHYQSGARMNIIDQTGKTLINEEINAGNYFDVIKPDVSSLAPGMYIVIISSADGMKKENIKFIKTE